MKDYMEKAMENNLSCKQQGHQKESLIAICTEPGCEKSRLNCPTCLLTTHKEHINSMIKIQDIMSSKSFDPYSLPN